MRAEDALLTRLLPHHVKTYLTGYFHLTEPRGEYPPFLDQIVIAHGLGQADVVLALLRGPPELHIFAEILIGRRIERLPGVDIRPLPPTAPLTPPADRRRVTAVKPNPRLPTTDSFQRFKHFRVGKTVAQLLLRGVTRRDIREAVRNGWVRLSEATS